LKIPGQAVPAAGPTYLHAGASEMEEQSFCVWLMSLCEIWTKLPSGRSNSVIFIENNELIYLNTIKIVEK
jgi:hypothetical protein